MLKLQSLLFLIFFTKNAFSQCPASDLPNPNGSNKQCNCDNGNLTTNIIAGTIWPAWGTLNDEGIILPPANCSGTTCWRANVTCSFKLKGNQIDRNPKWKWNWIPTVQYPLGDKNFYKLQNPPLHLNTSNEKCSYFDLPSSIDSVNLIYGTDFSDCPTFFYQQDGAGNMNNNFNPNVKPVGNTSILP